MLSCCQLSHFCPSILQLLLWIWNFNSFKTSQLIYNGIGHRFYKGRIKARQIDRYKTGTKIKAILGFRLEIDYNRTCNI